MLAKQLDPGPIDSMIAWAAAFKRALGDAHRWLDARIRVPERTTEKLAHREGKSERSIRMTLSLAFVVPPIVEAAIGSVFPAALA